MKTYRKFLVSLLVGLLLATTALCACGSPIDGAASPSNLEITPPPASPNDLQPAAPAPAPEAPLAEPAPAPEVPPADPAPAPEAPPAAPAPAPAEPPKAEAAITEDDAKAMVLEKVPGATLENFWEFKLDRDDGRLEYEGTLVYDKMEYEFEIDAKTGKFRGWEKESIYD